MDRDIEEIRESVIADIETYMKVKASKLGIELCKEWIEEAKNATDIKILELLEQTMDAAWDY